MRHNFKQKNAHTHTHARTKRIPITILVHLNTLLITSNTCEHEFFLFKSETADSNGILPRCATIIKAAD